MTRRKKRKSPLEQAYEEFDREHPGVLGSFRDTERTRDADTGSVNTVPYWEDIGNREPEYGVGKRFIPMVGAPARRWTLEDEKKVNRVERALRRMPAAQRKLLLAYFVEHVKLVDLRNGLETRQAVYHRVMRAKARFEKEWRHAG